jgi:hypothetical protein
LRLIEEELAEKEQHLAEGVSPLITFFVAGRNLSQIEATVAYNHPSVEAGIKRTLDRHALVTRKTLQLLVDVLVSLDTAGETWSMATGARLLEAAQQFPEFKPKISRSIQSKLDTWLGGILPKAGQNFQRNLDLAAAVGSASSAVSETARYLLAHRSDRYAHDWGPPNHDESWYTRLRRDPSIGSLIKSFITELLPTTGDYYDRNIVEALDRLAPEAAKAFLAAAKRSMHSSVVGANDVLKTGALKNLDDFEIVLDAAVEVLEDYWSKIDNEIDNYDVYVHISETEGVSVALELAEAYVERVRDSHGCRRLAQHRHLGFLLDDWLVSLARDAAPEPDEVEAVVGITHEHSGMHFFWDRIIETWASRDLASVVSRLLNGHMALGASIAALSYLIRRAPAEWTSMVRTLIKRDDQPRLIEMMVELGALRYQCSISFEERDVKAMQAAVSVLPPLYGEICEAALALAANIPPIMSGEVCGLVAGVDGRSERLRMFRLMLDRYVTLPIQDDVRWLLANTTKARIIATAIDAATRHNISLELELRSPTDSRAGLRVR